MSGTSPKKSATQVQPHTPSLDYEMYQRLQWCLKRLRSLWKGLSPYTLHPTPSTPNPTPYTLNPNPTPYTLNPTSDTRHPTPHTPHPAPYTPHPTPLHPTPYTSTAPPSHICGLLCPRGLKEEKEAVEREGAHPLSTLPCSRV